MKFRLNWWPEHAYFFLLSIPSFLHRIVKILKRNQLTRIISWVDERLRQEMSGRQRKVHWAEQTMDRLRGSEGIEATDLCAWCVYNDVSKTLVVSFTWGKLKAVQERKWALSRLCGSATNDICIFVVTCIVMNDSIEINDRVPGRNGGRGRCAREWLRQFPAESSPIASNRIKAKFLAVVLQSPRHPVPVCLPDISSSSPTCSHRGLALAAFSSLNKSRPFSPQGLCLWSFLCVTCSFGRE